jgi:class 3 adenylate cyclase
MSSGTASIWKLTKVGPLKNLRACEKILTGLFEKHKGRLFNTGGDSFLAEFSSAVSAVECAVEFQKAIKERNSSEEASVKLQFRIGINSGDVIKRKTTFSVTVLILLQD